MPSCSPIVGRSFSRRIYEEATWLNALQQGLSSQRRRIAHIAFIEIYVVLSQIRSVHDSASFAEIQVDVEIKFLRGDGRTKCFEWNFGRLAVLQRIKNFSASRPAVTDIHSVFEHFGRAVAKSIDDAAPVGITAMPTCLHQCAIGDGSCCRIRIRITLSAVDAHSDKARYAFAIAHDHFGEFE